MKTWPVIAAACLGLATALSAQDKAALIADAEAAAPPELAATATIMDWEGNVLREGNGAYTCLPTPPMLDPGVSPMCMDSEWMTWGQAWMGKQPYTPGGLGISYMMAGDGGASNVDPYAEGPTDDNDWIVEGAHLMIILPDPAALEGLSTDPHNGGPYVMWKGTPYAHIMVPLE